MLIEFHYNATWHITGVSKSFQVYDSLCTCKKIQPFLRVNKFPDGPELLRESARVCVWVNWLISCLLDWFIWTGISSSELGLEVKLLKSRQFFTCMWLISCQSDWSIWTGISSSRLGLGAKPLKNSYLYVAIGFVTTFLPVRLVYLDWNQQL